MSVFEEMHPRRQFSSWREYDELNRMLGEAISRGFVEEVPVMRSSTTPNREKWFRDNETGDIFRLLEPEPPAQGWWERVDLEELTHARFSQLQNRLYCLDFAHQVIS